MQTAQLYFLHHPIILHQSVAAAHHNLPGRLPDPGPIATAAVHICADWGRVYYTNFLSCCALLLIFPACTSEHELLSSITFSYGQIILLAMSCAVGVCMSHAGYLMRSNVSATAGVVVGVVCKLGSVLLNLMIWDQHASPIQLCFLGMGLAGGSLFQQAPLRPKPADGKIPLATQDMHAVATGGQEEAPRVQKN